ncbi:hypothetical protein BIU92_04355 [Curtobacterium sp. MCBA15_003]|nr:hypothetical protein BIU92_04355 [Curtobacterium sp. MCBA15_003]OII31307.1 hypothetical protein BIU94_04910 [Curtobacterium sp. MMLR14_006]
MPLLPAGPSGDRGPRVSRRRGRKASRGTPTRRTLVWIAVLVVVLVVVDVVLVALALSRTEPSSNGTPGPVPTFSSVPRPPSSEPARPTSSAGPSTSATADPAASVVPVRRLLSASTGRDAWRAWSGACGGADGVLEHTEDGGASWTRVDLGDVRGAVLALRADEAGVSVVIGSGPTCATVVRTSTDGGTTWREGVVGSAGIVVGPDGVVLSSGTIAEPCAEPVEAAEADQTVAVVCEDGLVSRSGSSPWASLPVRGVRSLAAEGNVFTVARSAATGCDGVQLASLPSDGTILTPVGCAAGADTSGTVVVARAGTSAWLWAGDDVLVSDDGGLTW